MYTKSCLKHNTKYVHIPGRQYDFYTTMFSKTLKNELSIKKSKNTSSNIIKLFINSIIIICVKRKLMFFFIIP